MTKVASAHQQPRANGSRNDGARRCLAAAEPRRAFTLLEMIVVVIVLTILAALIVPRLTGNQKREFRAAVDKVSDLLTMYGQRQNLGQRIVGIQQNRYDNSIALIEIDDAGGDPGSGNWRIDPYVKPVRLPGFMTDSDVEFYVDGDPYDASDWPLSSEPGQERPTIEIRLRGSEDFATLVLQPHGVAPIVVNGENSSGINRTPIDLDNEGRSREDW